MTVTVPVIAVTVFVAFAVGALLKLVEDIPAGLAGIVGAVLVARTAGRGGGNQGGNQDGGQQ